MSGSVKGIILEIGGDTSGLQNALKKVNSSSSSLSRELRGINSLLKLDPKNTELLSQKQTVLTEKIEATEEKLKILKDTKEKADKAMAEGTEINAENYRNLQREIINTENQLKQMKVEASKWTKAGTIIDNIGNKVQTVGGKVGNLGSTLTKTVTPAVTGILAVAVKSMDAVDEGLDTVMKKTGATGESAKELQEVYKKVASEVPAEFGDIGAAVGEINTRLDLTGDKLEKASIKFLKFAKTNDMDVNTSVQLVTRAMGDAGIAAEEYSDLLDMLTVAGQKSGISMESLTTNLAKYGAPMRALGIDTKNAIAMFAGWEKAGVNTEIAFSGMKKAISNWGAAGKDSTKEFKKTLDEIRKCPDIASATTKAIEVFGAKAGPDLADAIKGGRFEFEKYVDALEDGSGTLENTYGQIIDEVDDAQLAMQNIQLAFHDTGEVAMKTLGPEILKLANDFKKLMERFDKLDPKVKQNIVRYTALAAAIGPVVKIGGNIITTTGKTITSLGKLCKTVAEVKNGVTVANNATGLFAKGLAALTTPIGATIAGVTLATGAIIAQIKKAEEETRVKFSSMGQSASDFYTGIQNAEGYLDDFNTTLFASTEEQEKLQKEMDEIQAGITKICKTASDERRGYTQEEITQLDEYFEKLRALKDREIAIQQERARAITQQATTNAEIFQGSLEEYKVQSRQWISTAQQQADKTIDIIEQQSIEETALLNQKYGNQANMQNEAYAAEYNNLMTQKQQKIDNANAEVAEVSAIYAQGYIDRANQDGQFGEHIKNYLNEWKQLRTDNLKSIENINNQESWSEERKRQEIESANNIYDALQRKHWGDMYKYMSKSEVEQLGSWLGMLANTEVYGGKISDENKELVDFIIEQFDSMPKKSKKAMQGTMQEMFTAMENSQPRLFSKASNIAGGILNRLRSSLNINTSSLPGHKSGLDYVPYDNYIARLHKGERVLTAEENKQLMQMEKASRLKVPNMKVIGQSVADSIKTVFTTPTIVINAQDELTPHKINTIIDTVNRRLGSQY